MLAHLDSCLDKLTESWTIDQEDSNYLDVDRKGIARMTEGRADAAPPLLFLCAAALGGSRWG